MEELGRCFEFPRVFVKQFEQIIKEALGDILRLFDLPQDFAPAKLRAENQRRESCGYVYTGKIVRIGELLQARCWRSKVLGSGLR